MRRRKRRRLRGRNRNHLTLRSSRRPEKCQTEDSNQLENQETHHESLLWEVVGGMAPSAGGGLGRVQSLHHGTKVEPPQQPGEGWGEWRRSSWTDPGTVPCRGLHDSRQHVTTGRNHCQGGTGDPPLLLNQPKVVLLRLEVIHGMCFFKSHIIE